MIDPRAPDYNDTPASPGRPVFGYAPVDSSSDPCLSIVTPFYNTGAVFHETAKSVLGQSLQQFEWIIVNDGSTDPAALEMLAHYRTLDRRIRVLDLSSNRGLSAARNAGFAAARTAMVLQLDSDDLLEPTAAEKWWWYLDSHPEHSFVSGFSVHFGAIEALWTGGFHEALAFLDGNRVDATCLVRTAVHQALSGYDELNRGGLEDWEFWIRAASQGFWGGTIPEFHDWYRRRGDHRHAWPNWDDRGGEAGFRQRLREKYPSLWSEGFPSPSFRRLTASPLREDAPGENRLLKQRSRLLLIAPWLAVGGADRFNLDLVAGLTARGWDVTIVTTLYGEHPWLPLFARHTPDVFVLERFLRVEDYPRFLLYLMQSRRYDVALVSNSEVGYQLLPYLSARSPNTALASYCHALEGEWKDGGYPRMALEVDSILDAQLVASHEIAEWLSMRGAESSTLHVCPVSIDSDQWRPDKQLRDQVRSELRIDHDAVVILTAARIAIEKQPEVIARSLLRLRERGIAYRALIAGDGPELQWLRDFIQAHRLEESVAVLGAIDPTCMRGLFAAADIFFLPSRREGIALSCYEAMSTGLAVVSADVGAQRELIIPGTGILVESGEVETEIERYAQVLAELVEDPHRRGTLGLAARARVVERFRLATLHDRLDELFRSLPTKRHQVVPPLCAPLCAARALEYLRVSRLADELWARGSSGSDAASVPLEIAYVLELQAAKRWLEEQYHQWHAIAESREATIVELKEWIRQLEEGKQWLETHYRILCDQLQGGKRIASNASSGSSNLEPAAKPDPGATRD
jgi:glycosyltransferase involved in cell wall biosynthesis